MYSLYTCYRLALTTQSDMVEELRKTTTSLLSKLYLPDQVETPALQGMVMLIRNIATVGVPSVSHLEITADAAT